MIIIHVYCVCMYESGRQTNIYNSYIKHNYLTHVNNHALKCLAERQNVYSADVKKTKKPYEFIIIYLSIYIISIYLLHHSIVIHMYDCLPVNWMRSHHCLAYAICIYMYETITRMISTGWIMLVNRSLFVHSLRIRIERQLTLHTCHYDEYDTYLSVNDIYETAQHAHQAHAYAIYIRHHLQFQLCH